jgi:two-component system response regulator
MANMNSVIEIILVEDNPSDAALTIRALQRNRLANNLIHLKDGAEAIAYILEDAEYGGQKLSSHPKVILLDLKMPKVDGIQVLRRLKAEERSRNIPVVVLTSSREDPDVKECYALGINSYVVKPVEFDAFIEAVGRLGMYWLLLNEPPRR